MVPVRSGSGVVPEPVTVAESLTDVPGITLPVWLDVVTVVVALGGATQVFSTV